MPILTRRELLLSVPALAFARGLLGRSGPRPGRIGDLLSGQAAPVRVRGLHQVTLAVSDLDRSLDFYQRLFGLPIQARHGSTVLLRLGSGPRFLALTEAGAGPPRIDHFGLAVEDFEVERVLRTLALHGIERGAEGAGRGVGPMQVSVSTRDGTPEVHLGDPDGFVVQLQDAAYCGGSGPRGEVCRAPEPAPVPGDLPLVGLSHLTIFVPDADRSNTFYQQVFGLDIQAYQASSPLLGVGPGVDFLMFVRSGSGQPRIDHVCFSLTGFDVERIQAALERHGVRPRPAGGGPAAQGPMLHWVTQRMPNRGGAPGGTPELYFSDPDGLSIQLQDVTYCGGGGHLGDVC